MFNIFSRPDKNQKILIKKYKKRTETAKALAEKISKDFAEQETLIAVGRLMGIVTEKTFFLESEEEFNFVLDFSLFEYQVDGKNYLQRYQEENHQLNENEAEMLQASLLSYTSLFKILETDRVNATVTLGDLLNQGEEIKIININLSKTAKPGILMFTRIVSFPDFNMASGMFCMFPENSERSLLKQVKVMMKKVKSDVESVQRFIAFFKLNRKQGLEVMTRDV
jgi:hypothetical protein